MRRWLKSEFMAAIRFLVFLLIWFILFCDCRHPRLLVFIFLFFCAARRWQRGSIAPPTSSGPCTCVTSQLPFAPALYDCNMGRKTFPRREANIKFCFAQHWRSRAWRQAAQLVRSRPIVIDTNIVSNGPLMTHRPLPCSVLHGLRVAVPLQLGGHEQVRSCN